MSPSAFPEECAVDLSFVSLTHCTFRQSRETVDYLPRGDVTRNSPCFSSYPYGSIMSVSYSALSHSS